MSNSIFHFKRFSIKQDKCAMKVGTDGVILGAWTDAINSEQILDVGTGSALIALMLAQRFSNSRIDALEIEEEAIGQAIENVILSPYNKQIKVIGADFNDYINDMDGIYDLVVCNPPYFNNSIKTASAKRNMARHSDSLTMEQLVKGSFKILNMKGVLSVIIPFEQLSEYDSCARLNGYYLRRRLSIIPLPGKKPRRVCLEFSKEICSPEISELVIEASGRHQYSEQFKQLTDAFYL